MKQAVPADRTVAAATADTAIDLPQSLQVADY